MAVKLRLSGGSLPGQGQTKILTSGTLSIGRGAGNDWVLPDPERHLSKTHCVLSVEHGRLVLTDVSTNGVHINGARQATARDSRTVLTDGDDFRLGDYTVQVSEVEDVAAGRGGGRGDDVYARGGGGDSLDPFDAPIGPQEGGSPLDIDPLDDPLGRPPSPGFQHPLPHRMAGPPREDPFDVAEERGRRTADPDADLFRGTKPTQEWQGPTQADHADAPKHAFHAPSVVPMADPHGIDFDALIGDLGPAAPPGRSAPPPAAPQPAGIAPARPQAPVAGRAADPFGDLDGLFDASPTPSPEPAAPPSRPPPAPPPPPPPPPRPTASADPFAEPDRTPPPSPPPPAPSPAPIVPTPAAPAPSSADARAVLQAFLEGAGVANPATAQADPAATLKLVGEVFRAMTEGLREVLLSRAAIKSDMRVEQTMIRAHDNNALKFSVNVDDAVLALLSGSRPGYMAPLAATKEAFADIKSHELAVMAGVQSALTMLMQRFEPSALEKRMSTGLLASVLPSARKARYWDSFTQVYKEIAREAEDDFQALFGKEFAKAYAAQTRKE